MLEIQRIRNQPETVVKGLEARHFKDAKNGVQEVLDLDERRRNLLTQLEGNRQKMNETAKSIGQLMKQGLREEAEKAKATSSDLKAAIKEQEKEVQEVEAARHEVMVTFPNLNHSSVPMGKNEADNVVVFENNAKRNFDFSPKPHWELTEKHNLISFELGNKITGAGFPVYLGQGARLQRALIAFFLDRGQEAGYMEVMPPLLINEDSGYGTGQLPDKEGQMYHVTLENLYLIPTAEVPITNLYRDVILREDQFPVKHCGYTQCFRREAGSYGKDVRGLNRLHQFDKVELVQVVKPETSYQVLEEMTQHVMKLLEDLGLPYRQLLLCTGDTGFTAAKTYDLEVFSGGQDRWLEVSSVSNFETFQANRLKLRYRDEDRKTQLAHTLNGSALALPRIMAGMIEHYQQEDGSIVIPEVLRPYTRFDKIG